ncbi:MAG: phosphatase PAP2 family protein [Methylobacteriaceae bacterium]|nr:phosphatase PAP2 family protein [Methylobacteriaceae bacterium]
MSLVRHDLALRAWGLRARLRLNEVVPLLTVAGIGFLGWSFIEIAGAIREGDTAGIDRAILLALRNPANLADPIGPSWVEEVARDLTGLGGHAILTLATLATVTYLLMTGRRAAALLVIAAVGGGMLLSAGLKIVFDRPRPDLVPHGARVYTASFPSGHATLSAVTNLTLGALLARFNAMRRVKLFVLGLAVGVTALVGASRVYLGVHWPSDVLGGWCLGAAWAGLCWYVALLLQRGGQVEGSRVEPGAAGGVVPPS